jgi:hypothetical protein
MSRKGKKKFFSLPLKLKFNLHKIIDFLILFTLFHDFCISKAQCVLAFIYNDDENVTICKYLKAEILLGIFEAI